MTCNPKWPEIQRQLFPGQDAKDRPDLICRVFKLKMDELLDDLINKKIFGEIQGLVWVVEFQKRGLPHLHCLIILKEPYKIRTTEQINRAIWAEIPNKELYPELYNRVISHMIHMPCNSIFR